MKKIVIFTRGIPLFFAVVLMLNSLASIFVVAYPFLKGAFGSKIVVLHRLVDTSTNADHISWIIQVILAYIMMTLSKGLYARKRRSWIFAMIYLVLLILNDILIGTATSEMVYLYIFMLILLGVSYKVFNVASEKKNITYYQFLVVVSVIFSLIYGIVGSYLLRDQFNAISTWTDAVYYTMVTYSTVGYGDILPVTQLARIFTSSMIVIGLGTFATGLTVVILPMIENRMKGVLKIMRRASYLKDHVILCGYTPLTRVLIRKLEDEGTPFIIIDEIERSHPSAEKLGYTVLTGYSTDSEILKLAQLTHANTIICLNEKDSDNILTIITAKELLSTGKKKVKIISRIDSEENINKAKQSGADDVISPAIMAAEAIMSVKN